MNQETNDIYLIPEGYEGYVYAVYNVPEATEVQMEDEYELHPINEKGFYATSTSDLDYGTVTDKYFYVDADGNRAEIDETCIRGIGTGSYAFTTDNGENYNYVYTGVQLTIDSCSEDFRAFGDGMETKDADGFAIIEKVVERYAPTAPKK